MVSFARRIRSHPGIASFSLAYAILLSNGCVPNAPNSPPQAAVGEEQSLSAGATVTLDGSASSDPDGDNILFAWTQVSGPIVNLSSATEPIVTFIAPNSGTTLAFELNVSDGQADATARVRIAVRPTETSGDVTEIRQHFRAADDPAVLGRFPANWTVGPAPDPADLTNEPEERTGVSFAPIVEEDLPPGATRELELALSGPSGVTGSVRWSGTVAPLDVFLTADGAQAVPGKPYSYGTDRGGSYLESFASEGGTVKLIVSNPTDVDVRIKMALGARVLN